MKILIASDSYKGSLSSLEVAAGITEGVHRVYPEAEVQHIAVADGGEGTVEAVVSSQSGELVRESVTGPNGNSVEATYGILADESAVIEMAAASGLPLVPEGQRDIMRATTYGTGELIRAALDRGCRRIYIGVGGSATNDGGVGMAQALGVSFTDADGQEIGFGGGELSRIARIDISNRDPRVAQTEIIVMSDVTNPLCGERGASAVYGPQKGADPEQVKQLDANLSHMADVTARDLQVEIKNQEGAGAAGGLGGGLIAFTGAKLLSGIHAILDLSKFEEKAAWADIVVTGEGRVDEQSAYGKVISGVAKRAGGKPVAVIAGALAKDAGEIFHIGIAGMESSVSRVMTLDEAMNAEGKDRVADAAERLFRAIRIGEMIASEG